MQKVLSYLTGLLAIQTNPTTTPSLTELDWKYMRASIAALPSPCYYQAFGSVIVNATSKELLCTGYNKLEATSGTDARSHPTEHGEVDAIRNCVSKFKKAGMSSQEIGEVWKDAWIYTTAEPCPMCATTILHSGFQRVISATSGSGLYNMGWTEYLVSVSMESMANKAAAQPGFGGGRPITIVVPEIAANETDQLFNWQFQLDTECPVGCHRAGPRCVEN
ncbi:hypothetical protein H072_5845 [Dactylellina haptotyla CBS 200.50]|uniref:CMP/dCMP-type deaminase domain-containing protein n=1 Tax=Dactylellina haptotyla (strain CBS 200.50) TaxID=1284197 RepID=S8BYF3_DACHA|nr:hypothetical protein H072_5845 [Dactylellina haptotyla CBS 200.50]